MTGCRNCENRTDGDCGAHGQVPAMPEPDSIQWPDNTVSRRVRLVEAAPLEAEIARLTAELARVLAERDEARRNYAFMVERAADEKLDGYRELGARVARAEQERDEARAELAGRLPLDATAAAHHVEAILRDYGATFAALADVPPGTQRAIHALWAELAAEVEASLERRIAERQASEPGRPLRAPARLRCDACKWESQVAFVDIPSWHGKPCPACGKGTPIGDADMEAWRGIVQLEQAGLARPAVPGEPTADGYVRLHVDTARLRSEATAPTCADCGEALGDIFCADCDPTRAADRDALAAARQEAAFGDADADPAGFLYAVDLGPLDGSSLLDGLRGWAALMKACETDPLWSDGKHSGDCTRQSHTCARCLVECYRDAWKAVDVAGGSIRDLAAQAALLEDAKAKLAEEKAESALFLDSGHCATRDRDAWKARAEAAEAAEAAHREATDALAAAQARTTRAEAALAEIHKALGLRGDHGPEGNLRCALDAIVSASMERGESDREHAEELAAAQARERALGEALREAWRRAIAALAHPADTAALDAALDAAQGEISATIPARVRHEVMLAMAARQEDQMAEVLTAARNARSAAYQRAAEVAETALYAAGLPAAEIERFAARLRRMADDAEAGASE